MQIRICSLLIFAAMVFQFFADYFKHRLTAKSRHGTHSPFVYKLTDEVIYDFSNKKVYNEIETLRKKLLRDDSLITINDLDDGINSSKNRQKKVNQIAKSKLKSPRLVQLIYRLAANNDFKNIVEIGNDFGITTAYLAKAKPKADILTLENCPEVANIAYTNFTDLGLQNVELQVGNLNDLLPKAIAATKELDFVYISGKHNKLEALNYFNLCLPQLHKDSLLIIDSIYWNHQMKEAWTAIKNHPQVTVTIDLFSIGLVYFREGQAKEHFRIKF